MPDSSFVRYLVESKVKMFVYPKGGLEATLTTLASKGTVLQLAAKHR